MVKEKGQKKNWKRRSSHAVSRVISTFSAWLSGRPRRLAGTRATPLHPRFWFLTG